MINKLVIATHNPGKVVEIADLLKPFGVEVSSAITHDLPEPEETGDTFAANAILKAEATAKATGLPAMADDSGLSVTALGGAPGIYSARWAETGRMDQRDFNHAMALVHEKLADHPDKSAKFVCSLALAIPGEDTKVFEGEVHGKIVDKKGNNGFGYDPIFQPVGYDKTFGELDPKLKHDISHRANAFKKLQRVFHPSTSS